MNFIIDFFSSKGFNFKQDLKLKEISFEKNYALSKKVKNKIFFYQCPSQTKTSFYLINVVLSEIEFSELRKFIWNENKADLIFTVQKNIRDDLFDSNVILNLHYAKSSPKNDIANYKIDSFQGNEDDSFLVEKINKWQFDSGAFWFNYKGFIDKIKKSKSIDKELIYTLEGLKKQLLKETNDDDIVQALIDRTLYIKYLEDNHIINSYFYNHYFQDENLTYKCLLENNEVEKVNYLFKIINEIFNNYLFVTPEINERYLNERVLNLIYHSISGTKSTGQLSLFDFQFNVIPVEFISYIYEIFLKEEQKENGIFYTPKKLAQLIIDDVIPIGKIGKVLDPSCGSGMFLIVAFQKLLENNPISTNNVADKIEHRIKLLSENIFGIEKQSIAQRFTIFSLSLQIFRDLNPEEIKDFIANELKRENGVELFRNYSFFDNIVCQNTLDLDNIPFENLTFDYIVGNPPFFEIKKTDAEFSFLSQYKIKINEKILKATDIIGKHQISQCFLLKIKDWSNLETRFGFVANNSNFYNDNSKNFQIFFYENYRIEKLYELSKVKKILFENAKESVNAIIFSNKLVYNNHFEYYPVEMGLFSEKPFELLIIQEDKALYISKEDILNDKIKLRDYLIGNQFDLKLLKKLENYSKLDDYLLQLEGTNRKVNNGIQIVGKEQLVEEFNLSEDQFKSLNKDERKKYSNQFKLKYTRSISDDLFSNPLISTKNLSNFELKEIDVFVNDISNFHRIRNPKIYTTKKILINRIGTRLKAFYSEDSIYYNFDIYSIFPANDTWNHLFTAILNSHLTNYFINSFYRKRNDGSFPKIGYDAIINIPIPENLDNTELVNKISKISQDLTLKKLVYNEEIENNLNQLIFNLYDLTYLEKQRINDFFIKKSKIGKLDLKKYEEALLESITVYFENSITIKHHHYTDFNLIVLGVYFNSEDNSKPITDKVSKYMLNEIFKENPGENFLASQEKIFAKDCIYILRKDDNTNWSETKAFEDGQEILNRA